MIDHSEADVLAGQYLAELEERAQHRSLAAEATDQSLESAYAVQDAFHRLLVKQGHHVAGYKVALTSRAMQEFVGVDRPLAGAVFDHVVHSSPATVRLAEHRHLGVEFEVAVEMGADLVSAEGPHTKESVAPKVSACRISFELVEDRNADYSTLNPFDLVAENAWNAGVVLADVDPDWVGVDLVNGVTRLSINGEPIGEGRTGDALGHPLEAVAFLANNLNDRGLALQAGQFVMTGSSIVTQFPSVGDELVFTIDGLGEARLSCL